MDISVKEQLLDTLDDLCEDEFEKFKWFLRNESRPIRRSRLERADRMDVVDQVVQTYSVEAFQITVRVLEKIRRNDLVVALTEVNSKNEVKTTVCHIQKNYTATNGGIVFNPKITDCQIQTLNITITSQGPACGHMTEQSYLQLLAPPPERPLSVFPSQVLTLLNLQRGHVDADDVFLLGLMEQLKTLEPQKKSQLMLKFQQMIHETRFDSDTS